MNITIRKDKSKKTDSKNFYLNDKILILRIFNQNSDYKNNTFVI